MTYLDYFKLALQHSLYTKQEWVIRAFSVTNLLKADDLDLAEATDYQLVQVGEKYGYVDPESTTVVTIDDSDIHIPLLNKSYPITLKPGDLANVTKKVDTHVGIALFNAICLVYPFGDRIEYINEPKPLNGLEKRLPGLGVDEPEEGAEVPAGKITPSMLRRYLKATSTLTAYSTLFVPAATKYTLTPAPEALKRLKELKQIHKDELNNPSVVAAIAKEIIKLDQEYIANDPNAGLYQKNKSFAVVRMRKFYMHGLEFDFDGNKATFIENSLSDGWDIKTLPYLANSLRDGSFKRGSMTALGGEKTKTIFRVLAGVTVADEDCGTNNGITVLLDPTLHNQFLGSYLLDGTKSILLDDETVKPYLGKVVTIRSPGYCKASGMDFCIKCMGEFSRGKENALPALSAEVGTKLMSIFMSAMHGSNLETNQYDIKEALS